MYSTACAPSQASVAQLMVMAEAFVALNTLEEVAAEPELRGRTYRFVFADGVDRYSSRLRAVAVGGAIPEHRTAVHAVALPLARTRFVPMAFSRRYSLLVPLPNWLKFSTAAAAVYSAQPTRRELAALR